MNYTERRKEQAQHTETEILNAALRLMREKGFEAVTVREICREAGITTGAFYHHFQSKEELFDKGFAPLDQYIETLLKDRPAEGPTQRLEFVLRNYALFIENCGELAAQYYQRRLSGQATVSMDATRAIRRVMIQCFEQEREQGKRLPGNDPIWTVDFCYRHFRGVVIDWLLAKRSYSLLDRMMEEFKLFLDMTQA